MGQLWWGVAAAAAVPALLFAKKAHGLAATRDSTPPSGDASPGRSEAPPLKSAAAAPSRDGPPEHFVCERVCTSPRMLNKVGAFSKDPTPDTCVTVCGTSVEDACTDACRRTVCVNPHHVPNWNDLCMRRCSDECLRNVKG